MLELWINQLKAYQKPESSHAIGVEFEFLSLNKDNQPVSINEMSKLFNLFINNKLAVSKDESQGKTYSVAADFGLLTLEPGCQLELSTPPRKSLKENQNDLNIFLDHIKNFYNLSSIKLLPMGFNPINGPEKHYLLPKPRYKIMNDHFLKTGKLGQYMMRTSASTQVSIDFKDLTDLTKKLNLAFKLAPFLRAIFANSPFAEQKLLENSNCMRTQIWNDTDLERSSLPKYLTGTKPILLEEFLKSILDMPAMFYLKDKQYLADKKIPFLEIYPDILAREDNFELLELHNSQSFFEARIKKFLEIRMPDAQIKDLFMAPPALIKALFTDQKALDEATNLVIDFSWDEIRNLLKICHRQGFKTKLRNYTIYSIIKELLKIAETSLSKQVGPTDTQAYLGLLLELILEKQMSPSEYLVRLWQKDCQEDMTKLINKIAIY